MLALDWRQHILATPLERKILVVKPILSTSYTTMVKLSDPGEINVNNISRASVDELPPEDRQVYEIFIKECEEENIRRKEK